MQKKKILHVVGHLGNGGDSQSVINVLNYISYNNCDYTFDFLTHEGYNDKFVDKLKKNNVNVSVLEGDARIIGPIKYYRLLVNFFRNNPYDAVHFHTSFQSFVGIIAAKRCGIKVRVCHSHTSDTVRKTNRIQKLLILPLCRVLINIYSTKKICCSKNAGEFLFGKHSIFEIIYNGIDIEKIKKIDDNNVERIVNKYNIDENDIIVGQVGRFDDNKNQLFTIGLAEYFWNNNIRNIKFFLIGDGSTYEGLKKIIDEKKLGNVFFTGMVDDVNNYMFLFDYLLLPSRFGEGLPVTLIEQQIVNSNCICLVSDIVTNEANIGNVKYLNLKDVESWIKIIENGMYKGRECDYFKFDINNTAKKWLNIYK